MHGNAEKLRQLALMPGHLSSKLRCIEVHHAAYAIGLSKNLDSGSSLKFMKRGMTASAPWERPQSQD
jgi:hypothetical protein